jgi:AcrR family transcriptional regulator
MGQVTRQVKPRRRYDGTKRREQSAATRRRILDAARVLILERGYRATTIAAIAAQAEVNVDSVYELVGRKPVVLRELIEQAISGSDRAVPAEERDYVRAMQASRDPVEKLEIYARAMRKIHARMAPLHLALRDASSTESEAQEVWRMVSERRAANMRRLVEDLKTTGRLRQDISVSDAADVVWITNSAEVYVMLTVERGWSPLRYERWLVDSWCRLLLS